MIGFVFSHSLDLGAFAVSALMVLIYQLHFWARTRKNPSSSALDVMSVARRAWVECVMQERRDILAVQTLRNSTMTSSFMASTAILLIIGVLTLSAQGDKLSGMWREVYVVGHETPDLWMFKLLVLLFDLLFAFFAFSLSMRLFHHIGYLISVPLSLNVPHVNVDHITHQLNRAAIHYRIGMRAYFFTVPLVFWLFNAWLMVVATVATVVFLYFLDRAAISPQADGSDL